MKREKIICTFLIMPIILFSASLKHFRFDRDKKPNPSLFRQGIKSLNKSLPLLSKEKNYVSKQVRVKSKPSPSEQAERATASAYQSREFEIIRWVSLIKQIRFGRSKKPNPSFSRQQNILINKGQPFYYSGPLYRPDQVLVKFKPSFSAQMIEATIAAYQSKIMKKNIRRNRYYVKIPKNSTVEEMIYILSQNPDVEYVGPIYKVFMVVKPNDPLFEKQYALYNYGQEFGPPGSPQHGEERADIKATEAWGETTGKEDVIIAVLDTGVDLDHPDIENKIQPGGYDFINNVAYADDDLWHGTHVAGIAAAETNNNDGIAGVAWNCKILPIKILDENGESETYDPLIDGIEWAVEKGAHIINLSVGGFGHDPDLEDAVKKAYEKDIVIVAAAGNDGGSVLYPAAYDDYCLAVAATDYNDERSDWSNYGPEVDVAAPGDLIFSLYPESFTPEGFLPYAWASGTSMSTPHAAGLAALIKSIKPWLKASEIMNIIRYSADDINSVSNPGVDELIGYGRINMEKALVPIIITSSKQKK